MLSIVSFCFSLILFLVAVFCCLFLPGFWLVKKNRFKVDGAEILAVSLSLGIVLFVLTSIVLGFLKIRFLLLWLILLADFLILRRYGREPFFVLCPCRWQIKKRNFFWFGLTLGFITQIWINVFSGWLYADGIRFWSAHGHDAVWHGSLMQEIAVHFPPRMRFIGNLPLKNYHFFVDILLGEFHRLFGFNPMDLYFRHFSFVFAFLFLLNVFVFVRNWSDEAAGLWAMLLTVFSGSFGFLVTLGRNKTLFGVRSESIFWVSQGNTAIGNPPQMIAFILFLAFLNLFCRFLKEPNNFRLITLGILGGMLFGFKIYAGATILAGLGLLAGYELVFLKKTQALKVFLVVLLPALVIFFSTTQKGGSFLVLKPFWFVRTMVVAGDRLGWNDLEMRRQFYQSLGGWRGWIRVIQFESLALAIFTLGNLGTKVLGFSKVFQILASRKKIVSFNLFLFFGLLACSLTPHVFVQKGIAWNTVQFFHYFVLLMGLFSGATVAGILQKSRNRLKPIFIAFLVLFSVPTVLADLKFFSPRNALAIVENEELRALEFLKKHTSPEELILTVPYDRWAAAGHPGQPRPIYSWDSTGYVSYFTNRPTFLSDQAQVEIMGYPEGKERLADLYRYLFYSGSGQEIDRNPQKARQFLEKNKLRFVYLVYDQKFSFNPEEAGLEEIYRNQVARIYRLKN
ncbi:MAG: hypothetical protein JW991_04150 [Candidatus Pacebacteria bacterium]|nr:hypothetical protein [Candidatus Paceibacterota bacterium]